MSRLLWLIGVLAALAAGGQAVVPPLVDQALARSITPLTGPASVNQVQVTAVPFWTLAAGRFQDLTVTGRGWQAGPLKLSSVGVDWQDGAVNVADLLRRRQLVPSSEGHMRVRIAVDGPALAHLLEKSGRVTDVVVNVRRDYVELSGTVRLNGLSGRVTAEGTLDVSPNKRQILFHPTQVDGVGLPFRTSLPIFSLDQVELPVTLELTSVRLSPPDVVVEAATP